MRNFILIAAMLASCNVFSETGILILAHGSMKMSHKNASGCNNHMPSSWEKAVLYAQSAISSKLSHRSEVAFGMWNTKCIDAGITRLSESMKKDGTTLDDLIVLPLFISSHSAVIEMQKFIFKIRQDRVIPIPSVTQTTFSGTITYLKAMDYHPTISLILADRLHRLIHMAKEQGISKKDMELVLVMHGPVSDNDNIKWINFAKKYLRDLNYLFPLSKMNIVSLRDDADSGTREAATLKLRNLITSSTRSNKTSLILPLLLSNGGIEKGIIKRMEGLSYIWEGKMLLPDTMLETFLIERLKNI